MVSKKKKRERKQRLAPLIECQRERKKARSLGYQNTDDYEKGLSTIKRLLAEKNKKN